VKCGSAPHPLDSEEQRDDEPFASVVAPLMLSLLRQISWFVGVVVYEVIDAMPTTTSRWGDMSTKPVMQCDDFRALAKLAQGPSTQVEFVLRGDAAEVMQRIREVAHLLGTMGNGPGRPRGRKSLLPQQVLDLRGRCAAGEPAWALALEFEVPARTILSIVQKKWWKGLGEEATSIAGTQPVSHASDSASPPILSDESGDDGPGIGF
jgi:hypothetical protein